MTYLCCHIVANGIDKCFSCIFVCQMSQFYLITFIKQHTTCTHKWGTTSSKGCYGDEGTYLQCTWGTCSSVKSFLEVLNLQFIQMAIFEGEQ